MAIYTYSIQNDFPNHKVATDRLQQEIVASAIVTAVDRIDTAGDVCSIVFKASLSSGDQTLLAALVAAHTGEPLPSEAALVELDCPAATDGKPIFLPSLLPRDSIPHFSGAGDDLDNGTRFTGDAFRITSTQAETVTQEVRFIEWTYVLGGRVGYSGAVAGDEFSVETIAPATVGASTPGAGSWAKVSVGPSRNIYVPALNGGWTLDLTEKYNSKVNFAKVVPVPAPANNGYIDWNEDTEEVTVNPLGKGGWNLFDFDVRITRFLNRAQLLGTSWEDFLTENSPPKKLLAQWKLRAIVTNSSAKSLQVVWRLYNPRKNTT